MGCWQRPRILCKADQANAPSHRQQQMVNQVGGESDSAHLPCLRKLVKTPSTRKCKYVWDTRSVAWVLVQAAEILFLRGKLYFLLIICTSLKLTELTIWHCSRQGLLIIDLENPWLPPRVLPHMSKWEVADVQWSPYIARESWIASTVWLDVYMLLLKYRTKIPCLLIPTSLHSQIKRPSYGIWTSRDLKLSSIFYMPTPVPYPISIGHYMIRIC